MQIIYTTLLNNNTFLTTWFVYFLLFYPTSHLMIVKMKEIYFDIFTGDKLSDIDNPLYTGHLSMIGPQLVFFLIVLHYFQ